MNSGVKQTFVGDFFEAVGHHIIGGDLSRNEDGDIALWRTSTAVEVKASGYQSSYGFRLNVEQLENYERVVKNTYPFSRAWYMFFAYHNASMKGEKSSKRSSELSRHHMPSSIQSFLASSVMWCLVADIDIVRRWKETKPHSTKSVLGHPGMKTVDLKCHEVYSFINGGLMEGLEGLELDPRNFGTLSGTIATTVKPDLFNAYRLRFPMRVVLPKSEISSVRRMLKRRGFNLRSAEVRRDNQLVIAV